MQIVLIVVLIALGYLLIYQVFPRVFKNYSAEKWGKLVLFLTGYSYVAFDLFKKGKHALLIALSAGALAFIYILFYSKRKGK